MYMRWIFLGLKDKIENMGAFLTKTLQNAEAVPAELLEAVSVIECSINMFVIEK